MRSPIFLPLVVPTTAIDLPDAQQNLFGRIIRDPCRAARLPKERECTEMLAALLLNAPVTRGFILRFLADEAQIELPELQHAEIMVSTEQSIRGKRDDLRIEGWSEERGTQRRLFLWTV